MLLQRGRHDGDGVGVDGVPDVAQTDPPAQGALAVRHHGEVVDRPVHPLNCLSRKGESDSRAAEPFDRIQAFERVYSETSAALATNSPQVGSAVFLHPDSVLMAVEAKQFPCATGLPQLQRNNVVQVNLGLSRSALDTCLPNFLISNSKSGLCEAKQSETAVVPVNPSILQGGANGVGLGNRVTASLSSPSSLLTSGVSSFGAACVGLGERAFVPPSPLSPFLSICVHKESNRTDTPKYTEGDSKGSGKETGVIDRKVSVRQKWFDLSGLPDQGQLFKSQQNLRFAAFRQDLQQEAQRRQQQLQLAQPAHQAHQSRPVHHAHQTATANLSRSRGAVLAVRPDGLCAFHLLNVVRMLSTDPAVLQSGKIPCSLDGVDRARELILANFTLWQDKVREASKYHLLFNREIEGSFEECKQSCECSRCAEGAKFVEAALAEKVKSATCTTSREYVEHVAGLRGGADSIRGEYQDFVFCTYSLEIQVVIINANVIRSDSSDSELLKACSEAGIEEGPTKTKVVCAILSGKDFKAHYDLGVVRHPEVQAVFLVGAEWEKARLLILHFLRSNKQQRWPVWTPSVARFEPKGVFPLLTALRTFHSLPLTSSTSQTTPATFKAPTLSVSAVSFMSLSLSTSTTSPPTTSNSQHASKHSYFLFRWHCPVCKFYGNYGNIDFNIARII